MSTIAIRNAQVFFENRLVLRDVLVDNGVIAGVGRVRAAEHEIDARGRLLLPGAIDAHVHFRDLNEAYKEDWYTGSCAAAAGGVTTVIDQPNTKPATCDNRSYSRKQRAARKSIVDYAINAAIDSPDQLEELWRSGVAAFGEVFIQDKSVGELQQALRTIKRLDAVCCVHAEKNIDGNPDEVAGLTAIFACNEQIGAKLHVSHLSTPMGLRLASAMTNQNVTCESTPHHLFLSSSDRLKLRSFGIMNPPLRSVLDVHKLWAKLSYIDMIASDHAPHSVADKKMPYPPPGVPGVQTMLPLLLARLDRIGVAQLVRQVSTTPAMRFGLKNKGAIVEGFDADLVLVDPGDKRIITPDMLFSKCGWTPFEGCVAVFPSLTIVRGRIVFREGSITSKRGWGNQVFGAGWNSFE